MALKRGIIAAAVKFTCVKYSPSDFYIEPFLRKQLANNSPDKDDSVKTEKSPPIVKKTTAPKKNLTPAKKPVTQPKANTTVTKKVNTPGKSKSNSSTAVVRKKPVKRPDNDPVNKIEESPVNKDAVDGQLIKKT